MSLAIEPIGHLGLMLAIRSVSRFGECRLYYAADDQEFGLAP